MTKLIDLSVEYIEQLFRKKLPSSLCYHNLIHTRMVVDAVQIIGNHMSLTVQEQEMVTLAAWFHDVGFTITYQGHEKESISLARLKLIEWGYPLRNLKQVEHCILATRMPQSPKNNLEEILCDADLYHMSQSKYWHYNDLLFEELTGCMAIKTTYKEWLIDNIKFLQDHKYFTSYAQRHFEPSKQCRIEENIKLLEKLNLHAK